MRARILIHPTAAGNDRHIHALRERLADWIVRATALHCHVIPERVARHLGQRETARPERLDWHALCEREVTALQRLLRDYVRRCHPAVVGREGEENRTGWEHVRRAYARGDAAAMASLNRGASAVPASGGAMEAARLQSAIDVCKQRLDQRLEALRRWETGRSSSAESRLFAS